MRPSESLCKLPHPTHGSFPILTLCPLLMRQVIPSLRSGRERNTTFQMLDMLCPVSCGSRNQSIICAGLMYFAWVTRDHKLSEVSSCQPSFAASAFAKRSSHLMPQPPQRFGLAMMSHFTHAKIFPECCPFHRNLEHIF